MNLFLIVAFLYSLPLYQNEKYTIYYNRYHIRQLFHSEHNVTLKTRACITCFY